MFRSPIRIAVTEDEKRQYDLTRRILEKAPFPVISTHIPSGEELLKRNILDEFDMILLDYKLPGINGVEVIEKLREQEIQIPIILVSAFGTEKIIGDALEKGADDFVIKDSSGNYLKVLNFIISKTIKKVELQHENFKLQQEMLYSQKMQLISTLARGIAHDFNNALVGIIGYADLLKLKLPKDNETSLYVDRIYSSAKRMATWIKQLLAYSKAEEYKLLPLHINNSIKKCIQIIEPSLEKRIQVFTSLANDLHRFKADKNQIEQVITNILLNAIEAIPAFGEIRITTENVTNPLIEIAKARKKVNGMFVHITVEDNGSGMDKQTLDRMFEPFFSTKFVGRGLGLAAVYGIVDHHNGYITIESEPGKGTRVELFFLSIEEKKSETNLENVQVVKNKNILVIDDETITIEIIKKIFQEKGFSVLEARDGKEGIELYRANKDLELIILDLILPKKDGIEIFDEIIKTNPSQKVLICSGYDKDKINELVKKGATGFIAKPFTIEELISKIDQIITFNEV